MSDWSTLPIAYRRIAEEVCTPLELRVFKLRLEGQTQASIAIGLDRSRSTIRTLEHRAYTKIATHPDFPKEHA